MPPESSGSMGLDHARPPEDEWPEQATRDEPDPNRHEHASPGRPGPELARGHDLGQAGPGWPQDADDERDPDWPDDWPDEDPARPPAPPGWPAPPHPPGPGRPGSARGPRRPLVLAVVALAALAAGAGIALAASRGPAPSAASAAPSQAPSFGGPGPGQRRRRPARQGGGGGPVSQLFVGGKVLKVSSTSISIGGTGRSVTAEVTSATKVTGRVSGIGGVKVGDQVTAQITQGSGQATVTAIQDPGQLPSSGGLP